MTVIVRALVDGEPVPGTDAAVSADVAKVLVAEGKAFVVGGAPADLAAAGLACDARGTTPIDPGAVGQGNTVMEG